MTDEFPDKKPGDSLSAKHINALSRAAGISSSNVPGSFNSSFKGKSFHHAPFQQRVMKITRVYYETSDVDDESDESSWSSSSVSSSSRSFSNSESSLSSFSTNKRRYYEAQPLYYDADSNSWVLNDEESAYDLDASAFIGNFAVGDTVVAWWEPQRGAFIAQPLLSSSSSSEGGSGGSTVTGTCCCDELDCLKILGYTGEIKPKYYSILASSLSSFSCGCNKKENEEVILEQVDETNENIWESKKIDCTIPKGVNYTCTKTQVWSWNSGSASWDPFGDPTGCETSNSPSLPGFSGSVNGQKTSTSVSETKTSDGTATGKLYWKLTIVPVLVDGCDATTLTLNVV